MNTKILGRVLAIESRFGAGQIVNLIPPSWKFEGSPGIEVFCLDNLRIPYGAIMAFYETNGT